MGWDNFSYALVRRPEARAGNPHGHLHRLVRAGCTHICQLGFDFVWAGDDIAFKTGPMISPGSSAACSCPTGAAWPTAITLPWIFHSDGNFLPLLDDLLSLGMNALNPIEPDAIDIVALRRRLGQACALVGNIDINALASARRRP